MTMPTLQTVGDPFERSDPFDRARLGLPVAAPVLVQNAAVGSDQAF
jgi:hypothetical protein